MSSRSPIGLFFTLLATSVAIGCSSTPTETSGSTGEAVVAPSCTNDRQCGYGTGMYCAFAAEVCRGPIADIEPDGGSPGATGTCVARPRTCGQFVLPVCGCDGNTFDNACWAARAGVSVAHDGTCSEQCTNDNDCIDFPVGPDPRYCIIGDKHGAVCNTSTNKCVPACVPDSRCLDDADCSGAANTLYCAVGKHRVTYCNTADFTCVATCR